jgi:hypothetical protein
MQRLCVMCALLWVLTAGARAQQVCPWLTEGTAATLLGGPVTNEVHAVSASEGSCVFTRGVERNALVLRIEVGKIAAAECAAGEVVRGIGDEAWRCALDVGGEHREVIRGRVRATKILLMLTVRGGGAKLLSRDAQRSAVEQVAEEVSGTLF